MILKTYLQDKANGDKLGEAKFFGVYKDTAYFFCSCEELFTRKLSGSFRGTDFLTCKQCTANRRKNDDWGYRGVFKRMRHDAERRGIEFHLTLEHLKDLIGQSCHYCGVEGMNSIGYKSKVGETDTFSYNGLDRIDSDGHYTIDNVVPCCPICNRAKGTTSYVDFLAWIDRLSTKEVAVA